MLPGSTSAERASRASSVAIWRASARWAGSSFIGSSVAGGAVGFRPLPPVDIPQDSSRLSAGPIAWISRSGIDAIEAVGVIARYAPGRCLRRRARSRAGGGACRHRERPRRAKAFLFAASRLASFAERAGLSLDPTLLCEAVIERLVCSEMRRRVAGVGRTLRTNLRSLARSLERYREPTPVPLAGSARKRRTRGAEIDGYLRLAACQSTKARRLRASALICLGAGAGIIAGELRHLRGSDVVERGGGVLVLVSGARARSVPVLARYQQPLLEAGAFAGERLIDGRTGAGATQRLRRAVRRPVSRPLATRAWSPGGSSAGFWTAPERIGLARSCRPPGSAARSGSGISPPNYHGRPRPELVALLGGERSDRRARWSRRSSTPRGGRAPRAAVPDRTSGRGS